MGQYQVNLLDLVVIILINGYNSIDRHPITKGKFNGYIIMPIRLVDDNGKVYPHNMSYKDTIASQQSMLSKHYQKMIA